MQVSLRQHVRSAVKCSIKITHANFDEIVAVTIDLSDTGVFISHPQLAKLEVGEVIHGQVQDEQSDGNSAPLLMMEVVRVTENGAGLRFIQE